MGDVASDIETHYIQANKLAARGKSQNANKKMLRTLDDSVNHQNDVTFNEPIEDRMRIFEDEIIKRIKIIQNFVKTLDGKLKRIDSSKPSKNQIITDYNPHDRLKNTNNLT